MKSSKTMLGLCGCRGKASFAEAGKCAAQQRRETFAYQVLPDLQGKGLERKEASLLTSIFGYF
jgi:hypothetical protein